MSVAGMCPRAALLSATGFLASGRVPHEPAMTHRRGRGLRSHTLASDGQSHHTLPGVGGRYRFCCVGQARGPEQWG